MGTIWGQKVFFFKKMHKMPVLDLNKNGDLMNRIMFK